jgi:hypothetical protein
MLTQWLEMVVDKIKKEHGIHGATVDFGDGPGPSVEQCGSALSILGQQLEAPEAAGFAQDIGASHLIAAVGDCKALKLAQVILFQLNKAWDDELLEAPLLMQEYLCEAIVASGPVYTMVRLNIELEHPQIRKVLQVRIRAIAAFEEALWLRDCEALDGLGA